MLALSRSSFLCYDLSYLLYSFLGNSCCSIYVFILVFVESTTNGLSGPGFVIFAILSPFYSSNKLRDIMIEDKEFQLLARPFFFFLNFWIAANSVYS